jgi:uncharacterized protein YbaP (TraB family)
MHILRETGILPRMHTRRLRLLVPLLALACATPAPLAERAPQETGELVFWQVESASRPGGRAWLLGSVHAATPDLVLDGAIETAFQASNALVIEADITSQGADGFGFVERTLKLALLPEGQTLDQVLTTPTWNRLGEFLRERGQPVEAYRRFEPWLVMTMVTAYLFAEAGLPPEGGVDLRFTSRAEGRIPIVTLETPEFQLSLLDSLPLDTQARMLGEVLSHEEETRSATLRTYEAWRLGDLDAIERQTTAGNADPRMRDFHERVFLARNRTMAERVDELLREERTWFVVVGAGHMVGDQGIPALLAARGHRVSRIPKSAAEAPAAAPPAAPAAE